MTSWPPKRYSAETIGDFGEQWSHYTENRDFYASSEVLDDLFGPLLNKNELQGRDLADVGAGTGRYTRMFHELGAASVLAMEPSDAISVLERNTGGLTGIRCRRGTAEDLPAARFDWVLCIGVLQFIPAAQQALIAMGEALRPGGRLFLWVYGKEGNRLYLALVRPLRWISSRIPHRALDRLAGLLAYPAGWYASACRILPLPMARYMRRYYYRLDYYSRKLIIYDQLNPSFVRYYERDELQDLLEKSGFTEIRMHHRLGSSWSMVARHQAARTPTAGGRRPRKEDP